MGYHVIFDPEGFPVKHCYVERKEELVKIEGITAKSIIYEGDAENMPQQVGASVDYKMLTEDWYKAGLKAQVTFACLAKEQGYVLEVLSQDQESFKAYASLNHGQVKRGDFLIRNKGNIEVEVKCRSFFGTEKHRYFYFSEEDLLKHLNMQQATHTPVVIAIFQRKKDKPIENTLCMIKADKIQKLTHVAIREKKDYGWAYRIPVAETVAGFQLLAEYGVNETEENGGFREEPVIEYGKIEDDPYVLIAYYRNLEHLQWIVEHGLYNMRMGNVRGAICLSKEIVSARYILLHTKGETCTGKLFRILEQGPRVFTRAELIRRRYPGIPAHESYLVYKVTPVYEKELTERIWNISEFPAYRPKRGASLPFTVTLSELVK